jgi:hypothetical protein
LQDDNDTAAPADATAGNSQPQVEPGTGDAAQTTPESDARSAPGEGVEPKQPEGESAPEAADKQVAKEPKPRSQRRIETLSRERDAALRRADYYRQQAERGGRFQELDPTAFESDAAYQRALIKQSSRESRAELAKSEAAAAAEQAALAGHQIWESRVSDYEEAVPDFKQVAYSDKVQYSRYGLDIVRQMPEGPQIAYWLGKNTAEAMRLSQLSPLETAVELGRIAQRLAGPSRKVVSKAPDPVPTVRGRSAATGYRPDSDDMDAYHAWRDKLQ